MSSFLKRIGIRKKLIAIWLYIVFFITTSLGTLDLNKFLESSNVLTADIQHIKPITEIIYRGEPSDVLMAADYQYTKPASEKMYRGGPSNVSTSDHPHAGARDADGYWNYVPDVTFLRRKVLYQCGAEESACQRYFPLELEYMEEVCQAAPGLGVEGPKGFEILRHIQLNGSNPVPETFSANNQTDITLPTAGNVNDVSPPRILCAVYTHEGSHNKLKALVETWGWRCDGFFAASTKTVPDLGAVDLPHLGEEAYRNMWQKTRSILAFIFDNYIEEYDYFHLAGDDTYLIVENLRNYLNLLEASEGGRDTRPLYLGSQFYFVHRKWNGWEPVYNTGGPGYILNRLALRKLVMESLPTCRANEIVAVEDINVARCLFELNIFPTDTADATHRQRFFHFNPKEIASFDDEFVSKHKLWKQPYNLWAKDHGWKTGLDLVSTQVVAFHDLKDPVSMKRHHAIIYRSCPAETILSKFLTVRK